MVEALVRVNGLPEPYDIVDRRSGDLPGFWGNADKAKSQSDFKAKRTLDQMMDDTLRWQLQNPNG